MSLLSFQSSVIDPKNRKRDWKESRYATKEKKEESYPFSRTFLADVKTNSGDHNGKTLTVSRKLAKF